MKPFALFLILAVNSIARTLDLTGSTASCTLDGSMPASQTGTTSCSVGTFGGPLSSVSTSDSFNVVGNEADVLLSSFLAAVPLADPGFISFGTNATTSHTLMADGVVPLDGPERSGFVQLDINAGGGAFNFVGAFSLNASGGFSCGSGGEAGYAASCHETIPITLGDDFTFAIDQTATISARPSDGSSNGGDEAMIKIQFFEADGVTPALIETPEPGNAVFVLCALAAGLAGKLKRVNRVNRG